MITNLLPYLQTFLAFGNLVIMLWALKTFLTKPQTTLAESVEDLRKQINEQNVVIGEIKKSLDSSHEKHREQKEVNTVFINCMLAFIDFEIAFCQHTDYEDTEDLKKAKKTLQQYLSNK